MESVPDVPRDRLLPFLGDSQFAQQIKERIDKEGYVVLPSVFSCEEADVEYARMWRWVETVAPCIRRGDSSTWEKTGHSPDPWPCAQRDMMQLHQAGWVFSDLRERMADRVYAPLYGTDELHSSKDGFTLQRPTSRSLNLTPNDHFDQGNLLRGLQCIQGSVALTDQEDGDGCFLCWPGSHKFHDAIMDYRGRKGGRQNFIILNDAEHDWLKERGIRPLRVPVKKGDVILWRSDLVHKGAPPVGRRENFRAVVYICMLPAALTPEIVYERKQQAYLQLKTGSHWPCEEEWFESRRGKGDGAHLFLKKPPQLTQRQRQLYGLERYPPREVAAAAGADPKVAKPGARVPLSTRQAVPQPQQHAAAAAVAAPLLATVQRLARKTEEERLQQGGQGWTNPWKPEVDAIDVKTYGIIGDYNKYRMKRKGGTLDRAVSIMCTGDIDSLKRDGYEVDAGDFGENVSLQCPAGLLAVGTLLRAVDASTGALCEGGLQLEVMEPMIPCANLQKLPAIAALPKRESNAFLRACKGRRGWYAKVLQEGGLQQGDRLLLESAAPTEAAQEEAAAAPHGGYPGAGGQKVRRWGQKRQKQ